MLHASLGTQNSSSPVVGFLTQRSEVVTSCKYEPFQRVKVCLFWLMLADIGWYAVLVGTVRAQWMRE